MLAVHILLPIVSKKPCPRTPKLLEENVHETYVNPSLQIHLLQQIWKNLL
jgi:hypothetical protein